MGKKYTRRQYLTMTAMAIGGATILCSGLGLLAIQPPAVGYYRQMAADRDPSKPAVLVTYGTKAGSTTGVAQAVAEELKSRNFTVDISPVNRVTDLEGYSFVVIGSAIRMGAPLSEVAEFVKQHRDKLQTIPTAFFAVYLMNSEDSQSGQQARLAYLNSIRDLVTLQNEAFFTGVFNPKKVSFIEAVLGKMMKSPEGDFRDWAAISKWGQEIFLTR